MAFIGYNGINEPLGQGSHVVDESLLLTDDERNRFARYLENDIESSRLIFRQMEKLPGMVAVTAKIRQEIAAMMIVVKKLRQISSETINYKGES